MNPKRRITQLGSTKRILPEGVELELCLGKSCYYISGPYGAIWRPRSSMSRLLGMLKRIGLGLKDDRG